MSFVYSGGLQAAVYARLRGDARLGSLIGDAIFDAPMRPVQSDAVPDHITLGEERVRANDTKTSTGAYHDFTVAVHSAREGFDTAKRIAAAVCESLVDAPLALAQGQLVALRFLQAKAERGRAPEKRKVTLVFRAVVDQLI